MSYKTVAGSQKAENNNTGLIVGLAVALVVLLAFGGAVTAYCVCRRYKFHNTGIHRVKLSCVTLSKCLNMLQFKVK